MSAIYSSLNMVTETEEHEARHQQMTLTLQRKRMSKKITQTSHWLSWGQWTSQEKAKQLTWKLCERLRVNDLLWRFWTTCEKKQEKRNEWKETKKSQTTHDNPRPEINWVGNIRVSNDIQLSTKQRHTWFNCRKPNLHDCMHLSCILSYILLTLFSREIWVEAGETLFGDVWVEMDPISFLLEELITVSMMNCSRRIDW